MEAHALVTFLCSLIQILSLICVLVVLLCPSDDDINTNTDILCLNNMFSENTE